MNELIMLIGLPASGKSTCANQLKEDGYVIYSSDELMKELFGTVNEFSKNGKLFEELQKRIKNDLLNGENVVYDATNLNCKKRIHFIKNVLKDIDCNKKAVIIATPYNDCIDRDRKREKKVGSHVIEKFYKQFTMPNYQEGFDEIEIVYSKDEYSEFDVDNEFELLNKIHQNNKNHTKTIGSHCATVGKYLKENNDENLFIAGAIHDFGKKFCKSFKDSHNRVCNDAHYYNHENIGSYDAMFYLKGSDAIDIVDICNLIQYHMKPHALKTEKSIRRFVNFVGEEFWNRILQLHEADVDSR